MIALPVNFKEIGSYVFASLGLEDVIFEEGSLLQVSGENESTGLRPLYIFKSFLVHRRTMDRNYSLHINRFPLHGYFVRPHSYRWFSFLLV